MVPLTRESSIWMIFCSNLAKCQPSLNVTNEYGKTPLHEATSFGLTKIVELLLKNGANVNITFEVNDKINA